MNRSTQHHPATVTIRQNSFSYIYALSYAKMKICHEDDNLHNQILISACISRNLKNRRVLEASRKERRDQLREQVMTRAGVKMMNWKSLDQRFGKLKIREFR